MAALPTYIPLPEAARKYGYDLTELREMAESGKIEAVQLPDGDVIVSEDSVQEKVHKKDLPEYQEAIKKVGVDSSAIGIAEAARKYNLPFSSLRRWAQRGIIARVGQDGQKVLLNEVDVAYCAIIYERRGGGVRGRRLFNTDGTPYRAKTGPLSNSKLPQAA